MTSLPRIAPSSVGIDPAAVHALADRLGRNHAHSFMILRHGQVAAEAWYAPYGPSYTHFMYSLSKSFTSTAIGLACAEGVLSLTTRIAELFADELDAPPCPNMAMVTIRDLLMMACGHKEEPKIVWEDHWARHFIETFDPRIPGVETPAEDLFCYNSFGTFMLSASITKVTGQSVFEYLKPRLLDPLGITDVSFEENADGISMGGWGFNLHTEDVAKFGQLLLQDGVWEGKRLLPEGWVAEATAWQISTKNRHGHKDWKQGYCYQYWRNTFPNSYRCDGLWGQFAIVLPDQDMVVAMTNGTEETQETLDAVWEELMPGVADALVADPKADEELASYLKTLSIAPVSGTKKNFSGTAYFGDNALDIRQITFTLSENGEDCIRIARGKGELAVTAGAGCWVPGHSVCGDPFMSTGGTLFYDDWHASGAFREDGTYELTLQYHRTPYAAHFLFTFYEGCVKMDWKPYPNRETVKPVSVYGRLL